MFFTSFDYNIIKLVAETGISMTTIKDELKELEERKVYLEKLIHELIFHNREAEITEEMIADLVRKSKDFVKNKNMAECQQFIKTYVNKVVVHGEIVELLFNINVPNKNDDGVEPLMSTESINTLQRGYKLV